LDFSRTFPPTTPDANIVNGHLYQLFRGEFVRQFRRPLCPDAYSGFISGDNLRAEYNADIRDATMFLLREWLPMQASAEIVPALARVIKKGQGVERFNVVQLLHGCGINMRYIGVLLRYVPSTDAKMLLLMEAIARTLKNEMRLRLRQQMSELKVPLQAPYRRLVVSFSNMVFGDNPELGSAQFWRDVVSPSLAKYFYVLPSAVATWIRAQQRGSGKRERDRVGGAGAVPTLTSTNSGIVSLVASTSTNAATDADAGTLRTILGARIPPYRMRYLLFKRYAHLSGLKWHANATRTVHTASDEPFDPTDLEMTLVTVKHTNVVENAAGNFFLGRAVLARLNPNKTKEDVRARLAKAAHKFELALSTNPTNRELLLNLAHVKKMALEIAQEDKMAAERLEHMSKSNAPPSTKPSLSATVGTSAASTRRVSLDAAMLSMSSSSSSSSSLSPADASLANQPVGEVDRLFADKMVRLSASDSRVQELSQLILRAINAESEPDTAALILYAQLMDATGNVRQADQYYLAALDCSPDNVSALNAYVEFLTHRLELSDLAAQFYQRASAIAILNSKRNEWNF
jgi:Translation initiation factor eIF3 subunit 135